MTRINILIVEDEMVMALKLKDATKACFTM